MVVITSMTGKRYRALGYENANTQGKSCQITDYLSLIYDARLSRVHKTSN